MGHSRFTIFIFYTLIFLVQSCGEVKLLNQSSEDQVQEMPPEIPASLPPPSPSPSPAPAPVAVADPREDTQVYSGTQFNPGCDSSANTRLNVYQPVSPIVSVYDGISYETKVIGDIQMIGAGGSGPVAFPVMTFDPLKAEDAPGHAAHYDVRHCGFAGVLSFRFRTISELSWFRLTYGRMFIGNVQTGEYVLSISKYPGDIQPSKANSNDYCNIGANSAYFVVADTSTPSASQCILMKDSVYYLNVLRLSELADIDHMYLDVMGNNLDCSPPLNTSIKRSFCPTVSP